ncbi:MAG: ABC-type transport auxiliary lipoprotein family protein [Geobacteraceae bacterium]
MNKNTFTGIRLKVEKLATRLPIAAILIVSISFSSGCLKRGTPATIIEKYTFEYPSPEFTGTAQTDQTIKIERFSVARAFNSQAMVFRPAPYQLDAYASNRWMINPGDMVSDYLLRDLRNSGLFKAAFSFRDLEDARYVLEGSVDEFLEIDSNETRTAAITLSITLFDFSRTGVANRLLFQKKYQATEPITDKTPKGLAQAMSSGMAKLSAQIIRDTLQAVQTP